jgi:hypothetical protein
LLTIGHQLHIDKLCSIIGVDSQHGKGKKVLHALKRSYHRLLCAIEQGQELGPSCGNVSQRQRIQERPISLMATMSHQIGFHEACFGLIPILEGADRDVFFEQRSRSGGREPMALLFAVGS